MFRFYDHWLKGEDNGLMDEKPVQIFVMGINRWRDEDDWPLERAEDVRYYLHSAGKANTLNGNGSLSPESPGHEPPDTFVYNPIDPVPTAGGGLWLRSGECSHRGVRHREIEAREDVLVYSTPPLEEDMEVTGPITVTLYATSSAVDTDFTGKLLDVGDCGYARNLTDGIIRARYRTPRTPASLIEPGRVYEYTIDLWATSNVFRRATRSDWRSPAATSAVRPEPEHGRVDCFGGAVRASAADGAAQARSIRRHVTLPVVPAG